MASGRRPGRGPGPRIVTRPGRQRARRRMLWPLEHRSVHRSGGRWPQPGVAVQVVVCHVRKPATAQGGMPVFNHGRESEPRGPWLTARRIRFKSRIAVSIDPGAPLSALPGSAYSWNGGRSIKSGRIRFGMLTYSFEEGRKTDPSPPAARLDSVLWDVT